MKCYWEIREIETATQYNLYLTTCSPFFKKKFLCMLYMWGLFLRNRNKKLSSL